MVILFSCWYCWLLKSCTSWYGKYPIIYRVSIHPRWLFRISSIDSINLFSSRAYKSERRGRTIRWHSQPILDRLDPNSLELVPVVEWVSNPNFENLSLPSQNGPTVDSPESKICCSKNRSKSIVGRLASFLKVGFFFHKVFFQPNWRIQETSRNWIHLGVL